MNYTTGNWTVVSQFTDTISTPKDLQIPDLSYTADYSVARAKSADEVILINTTGSTLLAPEQLRYSRTKVADVYQGLDIQNAYKAVVKGGMRILAETRFNVQATNSVSGEEVILPLRGWTCLLVPTAGMITSNAVLELAKRTVATLFPTGAVTADKMAAMLRGDLDPSQ